MRTNRPGRNDVITFAKWRIGLIVCTALKFSDLCCEARTALLPQRQAVFTGQQVHHVTHLASVLLHLGEELWLTSR